MSWIANSRWRLTHLRAVLVLLVALGLSLGFLNAGTASAAAPPVLLTTPSSGTPGTIVTVNGVNFPRNNRVILRWDGSTAGMPTSVVGATGTFSVSFAI